jgi:glutamate/tyrosine decarboxylase-like PLP-dependent enzyme
MSDSVWQGQFLHPDRSNLEDLRQQGYNFVDLIVDEVLNGQTKPFVKEEGMGNFAIPNQGMELSDLLMEVRSQILPRSLNLHHPGYMGHMDSVPLAITIWADALVSALHNNMLSSELAPVFTQLESHLITWFAKLFGLGDRSFGTLVAGGSLANITALLVARNHRFPHLKNRGIENQRLVALVSDAAHNSFEKGMNVIGLGKEKLIRIPTNNRGEIDLTKLEAELIAAKTRGEIPFFIAAVAGTTVTGAVDPIPQVAEIAKNHDCWFHLDAAYGGAAIFSPNYKYLLEGSNLADSITFNPQKWLWVSRTCAMLLVSDRLHLEQAFDQQLPYMSEEKINFGNLTLQGTRRTDSLKLWLALKAMGTDGYGKLIDRSMENSSKLRRWLEQQFNLELVCEPTLNILCLRSTDPNVSNAQLRSRWIEENRLWLSLPLWQGDRILKAVVLHPYATAN